MKKFLKSKLILVLVVVATLFGVAASLSMKAPAMASTSCGQVLVKVSDWLGGHGVDVRSNGADMNTGNECNPDGEVYNLNANPPQYGFGWVCVELVNRLYVTKGWSARLTIPATYNGQQTYEGAKWLYTLAAAGYYPILVAHANGSNYKPVPGDMIVHSNGKYGHVTVVDHISGNTLYAVDQNRSPNGWESYAYNSSTGAVSMSGVPIFGYVHSTNNTLPASSYDLRQFYVSNGSWTSFDVSSATGVKIAGNPAVGSGGTWARDTNGHLQQFYVSSGSWMAFDASKATGVNVSGDPAISTGGVWERDANNHLRQFYVSNGSWTSFDVSSATGVQIAGNPVVASGGIYARDTNGHVRQFYVANGSWTSFDVSAATGVNINGDPAISSGGVWVRDTNNHMRQLYVSNGSWTAFDVSTATGVNINSNPVVDPNGGEWAQDTNHRLQQFYVSNGSWTHANVSGATGVNINGDPVVGSGGTWARDTNGHMRQFYVANGSWTSFDATNATGVSISLDPVVDPNGGVWAAS